MILLLIACTPNQPVENKVNMASWEYAMGRLADGATIKIDTVNCVNSKNCGVEFYVDGVLIPAKNVPTGKWFVVKRTDTELGQFVVVSTNTNESKIKFAKPGNDPCPDWAKDIYGPTCATSKEFSIHGK